MHKTENKREPLSFVYFHTPVCLEMGKLLSDGYGKRKVNLKLDKWGILGKRKEENMENRLKNWSGRMVGEKNKGVKIKRIRTPV